MTQRSKNVHHNVLQISVPLKVDLGKIEKKLNGRNKYHSKFELLENGQQIHTIKRTKSLFLNQHT